MRPSKWLVFIRPSLAGFDRPLTLPEIVAVVAGLKSEYFTSGLTQPLKNTLKLKSKMVAKYLMCVVGLTIQS